MICSLESSSGKTAFVIGLARHLQTMGLRLGYLKVATSGDTDAADAAFVGEVLAEHGRAVVLEPRWGEVLAANPPVDPPRAAIDRLGSESDLVAIEAGDTLASGTPSGLSVFDLVAAAGGRALLVLRYRVDLLDNTLLAARELGDSLLGVVINATPPSQLGKARDSLRRGLEAAGVRVFGVVPQDRVLRGISVRELGERLGAQVICCQDRLDDLVERLMIGTTTVDGALQYFRKHTNKAVITSGDRPDVQLAALATPTRCLVLTGGFPVDPSVQSRACEAGVPLLVVEQGTLGAVERINHAITHSRFRQRAKIDQAQALLGRDVDFAAILGALDEKG